MTPVPDRKCCYGIFHADRSVPASVLSSAPVSKPARSSITDSVPLSSVFDDEVFISLKLNSLTKLTSWDTIRTVVPVRSAVSRNSPMTSFESSGSREAVGPSASSSLGDGARALAIAARYLSPTEMASGKDPARCAIFSRSISSAALI